MDQDEFLLGLRPINSGGQSGMDVRPRLVSIVLRKWANDYRFLLGRIAKNSLSLYTAEDVDCCWHCPHSMRSRVYETERCPSVPTRAHSSKPAAARLLLWSRRAADIERLLQQRYTNASRAVSSVRKACPQSTYSTLLAREQHTHIMLAAVNVASCFYRQKAFSGVATLRTAIHLLLYSVRLAHHGRSLVLGLGLTLPSL